MKHMKTIAIIIALILSAGHSASALAAGGTATPTASTVYINGEQKDFEAYNIAGSNYFKLRDLAYVLSGTEKQFEVGYDNSTKAITLTNGAPYTSVDGDMVQGDWKPKTATPTASKIYLDGVELKLTAYNISGNNFFKLRDLMEALDVYVGYDDFTKTITLDTSKSYEPEALPIIESQSIVGTILDESTQKGIGGVRVILQERVNYTITETLTDADGTYKFDNLPDGLYKIYTASNPYGYRSSIPNDYIEVTLPLTDPVPPLYLEPYDPVASFPYKVTVYVQDNLHRNVISAFVRITHTSMDNTSFDMQYNARDFAFTCQAPAGRYRITITTSGSNSGRYSGYITVTAGGSNTFSFRLIN